MPSKEQIDDWREYIENKSDEDKAASAEFNPTSFGQRVSTGEKVSVSAPAEDEKSEDEQERQEGGSEVVSTSENTEPKRLPRRRAERESENEGEQK